MKDTHMSDPFRSADLALPLLAPAQTLKYLTLNEAFLRLDLLCQLHVRGVANVQPDTAEQGDVWLVGAEPTGDWAGQTGAIALRTETDWQFHAPQIGWTAFDRGAGLLRVFGEAGWAAVELRSADTFGVNATADATNRLTVRSEAVLLDHDGAGVQLKLNKQAADDTLSVLFQTDYAGRAELGLAGDDALAIKTSADGSNWTTALRVDPANATVDIPTQLTRGGHTVLDAGNTPNLMAVQPGLGAGVDLNTVQNTGHYPQSSNSAARSGMNYPIAQAGLLSVISVGSMSYQDYRAFAGAGANADVVYSRGLYANNWTAWRVR